MQRNRSSVRSHESSSSFSNDKGGNVKECCRKIVAFMCTQVGVGGLIVGYAIVGAFSFIYVETTYSTTNNYIDLVNEFRDNCSKNLWVKAKDHNTPEQVWTFPTVLMFCLSVFSMIGYGNMLPRTQYGKLSTVIYVTFGISLYVLYFMNIGKVLAKTFRWFYTWIKECSTDPLDMDVEDGGSIHTKKKIIVPSTACLWVMCFYILIGTLMFKFWENWDYSDVFLRYKFV